MSEAAWRAEVARHAPRRIADARRRARDANVASGRRLLVLDDDPTGSQSVHGVEAVILPGFGDLDAGGPMIGDLARALAQPGSACFVLTNSRSMPASDAGALARYFGSVAVMLERRLGGPITVVSRGDSTLRGHLLTEVRGLDDGRRQACGKGYDGVLLVPAYLEAGRFTAGDVHWARVGGEVLPVAETEFAKDRAFGFASSNLRQFLEEKSGGTVAAAEVTSVSLDDVRSGGPEHVAEILRRVEGGRFAVVNATEYEDLEVVALGVVVAQEAGSALLVRCGPSFVAPLAGIEPAGPLKTRDLWPAAPPSGHGLVVVGSHVGLTNRQVKALEALGGLTRVEVDVDLLVTDGGADAVTSLAAESRAALEGGDVLLITTRVVRTAGDELESVRIARKVSDGVAAIVRQVLPARPAWVLTKGGITSHDVLAQGLGVRRAEVAGQLFAGFVSVFRPLDADPGAIGMPCVVFAGNVGDDGTLAEVVGRLREWS